MTALRPALRQVFEEGVGQPRSYRNDPLGKRIRFDELTNCHRVDAKESSNLPTIEPFMMEPSRFFVAMQALPAARVAELSLDRLGRR